MVVFGGGNEGIVDELHVYNTGKFELKYPKCQILSPRWPPFVMIQL